MRSARRGAVLPLAIAVGGVLLASAPASATVRATWSKPTDNSTFTTTSPVDFLVSLDRGLVTDGAAVYLNVAVPGPTPGPFRVDTASGSDRDLKFTFTPACPNYAGSCSTGSATAYNGRYTASLSGAVTSSRTVVLQVPPAAPAGVVAAATGQRRVKVSWEPNREPDLTGYDVFTAEGNTIATNLPPSTLWHEFELSTTGYGGEHRYVVRAHRLACANCAGPDSGATLSSPMSAPASVTFTEPGSEPTPDPGSGGGTGSGSGDPGTGGDSNYNGDTPGKPNGGGNGGNGNGSGSGSGTNTGTDENGYNTGTNTGGNFSSGQSRDEATKAAQKKLAFGLTFKSFAPKLGAPKLPPLPQFAQPQEGEIPWGTYDPTLNYGDQTVVDTEKIASGGGITETLVDTFGTAFEGERLFRSIAIALLLLLAAGHLRVWLRSDPTH